MKKTLIFLVLIVLVAGGYYLFRSGKMETDDMVRVTSPLANTLVQSPLRVEGEARGNWYFEASFPVRVLDGNGAVLGSGVATAQGDWMTTEFVPFKTEVSFTDPTTANGVLVLQKDNPSGLPENDAEVRIPIQFDLASAKTSETVTLGLSESATVMGVTLKPLAVIEDSRCPSDVTCIQAGRVRVEVQMTSALGASTQTFSVGDIITTEGETVTLIEANPYPVSTKQITTAEYEFIFKVEKI